MLGGHQVNFFKSKNFILKEYGLPVSQIHLRNKADTDYASFRGKTIIGQTAFASATYGSLGASTVHFSAYAGASGYSLLIHSGVLSITVFQTKDGKVFLPALPTSDPADGTGELWNNGGVVTIGT